jgi:hypothetical protein
VCKALLVATGHDAFGWRARGEVMMRVAGARHKEGIAVDGENKSGVPMDERERILPLRA